MRSRAPQRTRRRARRHVTSHMHTCTSRSDSADKNSTTLHSGVGLPSHAARTFRSCPFSALPASPCEKRLHTCTVTVHYLKKSFFLLASASKLTYRLLQIQMKIKCASQNQQTPSQTPRRCACDRAARCMPRSVPRRKRQKNIENGVPVRVQCTVTVTACWLFVCVLICVPACVFVCLQLQVHVVYRCVCVTKQPHHQSILLSGGRNDKSMYQIL